MQKERKDDAKEPLKPRRAQDTIKGVSASATFGLQAQLLKYATISLKMFLVASIVFLGLQKS
jgi:hypothetical protein